MSYIKEVIYMNKSDLIIINFFLFVIIFVLLYIIIKII